MYIFIHVYFYTAKVYTSVMELFIVKQLIVPVLPKLFKSVTHLIVFLWAFFFASILSVFCDYPGSEMGEMEMGYSRDGFKVILYPDR